MNNKKIILWIAVIMLFVAAAAGGYYFFRNFKITKQQVPVVNSQPLSGQGDATVIRIYCPVDDHLEMTEKTVFKKTGNSATAESVIEEYFRLPVSGKATLIPRNVRLLGIYRDPNQIIYVDLSDELRRNFQGDALSEYLLIRGLYESLISNVADIRDVKILIEGKEADSLGGHMYLKFPLKNYVSYEPKKETVISDDQ